MARGILVSILRDSSHGDCTNGGVTSPARAPRGLAVLLGLPEGNLVDGDLPADLPVLVLVCRRVGGEDYFTAKPRGELRGCMAGGNFVYSSDSRFRRVCAYPISVHDRTEP